MGVEFLMNLGLGDGQMILRIVYCWEQKYNMYLSKNRKF